MTADQLTGEFESFQRELKSFLLRMTTSVQDAEDRVQETYLKARSGIDTFRGESALKTWVFSIASNLARDLLKLKKCDEILLLQGRQICCVLPTEIRNRNEVFRSTNEVIGHSNTDAN